MKNDLKGEGAYFAYVKFVGKNSRPILFSKYFVIFAIMFIACITLFSALYAPWGGTIDSEFWTITESIVFSLTFIAAITGILGDLFMDRASKLAFPFYIIYIVIYFTQCIHWALYYEALQQVIVIVLVFITFIKWNDNKNQEGNDRIKYLETKYFILLILAVIVITLILGSIMKWVINPLISDNWIDLDNDGWADMETPLWAIRGEDPLPFMDAFVVVAFLAAWGLFTRRYLNAYWMMLLCILGYFITYGIMAFSFGYQNYIVYFVTNFFYLFLNQTGMSNWSMLYFEQKNI